jgi:hypothetical protein
VCPKDLFLGANMRIKVLAFAASLFLISNSTAGIPQSATTTTSSPQAVTLLAQSAKALTGSTPVNDVTLTGTAEWIAGSDDETGTVTLKALTTGEASLAINLRSGTISEVHSSIANGPAGSWVGTDGTIHEMAMHNGWTDAAWFFPAFSSAFSSNQNLQIAYIGQESLDGGSVQHIRLNRIVPGDATGTPSSLVSHLSQTDLYFDVQSSLPVAVKFNIHPDNNAAIDIPVEVKYSNYQSVGGVMVPFHVQQFIQNSLHVDIQLTNANLNSGLTTSQFQVQ